MSDEIKKESAAERMRRLAGAPEGQIPQNFSQYPESINEMFGGYTGDNWTPREALVSMLRQIDLEAARGEEGLKPEAMVMCLRWRRPDGTTFESFENATPDLMIGMGLIGVMQFYMMGLADPVDDVPGEGDEGA